MVHGTLSAPKSKFRILGEEQNAAFDAEFHSPEELESKFLVLGEMNKDRPFDVLDLGGGNGLFVDQLLARFPNSSVTILEISASLLAKNRPAQRKKLVRGAIENMPDLLAGRKFDYITMNWVLHHLVGNSYRTCRENCLDTLMQCKELLKPNGMLLVAENMFDGYMRSNIPSHLIYDITAIKWPLFVRLAKRFFNTAGVGVCFQSQPAWERMFAQAGFEVVTFQRGLVWSWVGRSFRGIAVRSLFLKSVSHGHFFLRPRTEQGQLPAQKTAPEIRVVYVARRPRMHESNAPVDRRSLDGTFSKSRELSTG